MKMRCSEGSQHGDRVRISFYIPEQGEVDAGEQPDFNIDCLDLLVEEERNGLDGTVGFFVADALSVFMDEAHDAESAETVAEWLEHMAAEVRARFSAPNSGSLISRNGCPPSPPPTSPWAEGVF